jgi:putative hydrolase of the HAD superfamily
LIRNIIFDMGHVLLWYEPMPACRVLTETEQDAQTLYAGMPDKILFPVEGMAEVALDTVNRGFHVYLLSNAGRWLSRRQDYIPYLERFHGVMFSADEGLVKPDPRLYGRLMERYGLKPDECFFIEDREDNLQAAAALGWRTHRFLGDVQALKDALATL